MSADQSLSNSQRADLVNQMLLRLQQTVDQINDGDVTRADNTLDTSLDNVTPATTASPSVPAKVVQPTWWDIVLEEALDPKWTIRNKERAEIIAAYKKYLLSLSLACQAYVNATAHEQDPKNLRFPGLQIPPPLHNYFPKEHFIPTLRIPNARDFQNPPEDGPKLERPDTTKLPTFGLINFWVEQFIDLKMRWVPYLETITKDQIIYLSYAFAKVGAELQRLRGLLEEETSKDIVRDSLFGPHGCDRSIFA
ncbi:hypothetical protein TWF481_002099 [Arthrobotrys musiformis]|uniref:Uncharacterized protein n=1 Tax=Arthrobotrys musiformis TaxID=47236 RepID=A0AAV9VYB1_9PEZI